MKTIVGLFDNFSDAQSVVSELERIGIDRNNISLVANKDRAGVSTTGDSGGGSDAGDVAGGAVTGAAVGGVAGLVAGLAMLAIPGVGPVLAMGPIGTALAGAGVGAAAGGLIGALTTAGVPEEEAGYYVEGVRRGGTLVTVSARDEQADQAMDIMNRYNPVDIEERSQQWRSSGWTGSDMKRNDQTEAYADRAPSFAAGQTSGGIPRRAETANEQVGAWSGDVSQGTGAATGASAGMSTNTTASTSQHTEATARTLNEGEATLPVVEEELQVGKRQVQRGGIRVFSHVEERPVEEQVNLREEHATIERRPVNRPASEADFNQALTEGTIEVRETAEEAVVNKQARVVEEVVVGKEATQRTETVRDTVRRTDVEVEQVSGAEFDRYENDFRTHSQTAFHGSDYDYDRAKPAYRYGYELAGSSQSGDWTSVESDARTRWEERNPGTWDKVKDAARYAYDRARSKVSR